MMVLTAGPTVAAGIMMVVSVAALAAGNVATHVAVWAVVAVG